MAKTGVFRLGHSQAVRLPLGFQLNTNEVEIFKCNKDIIIREKRHSLSKAFELLTQLPENFFAEHRKDSLPQVREGSSYSSHF